MIDTNRVDTPTKMAACDARVGDHGIEGSQNVSHQNHNPTTAAAAHAASWKSKEIDLKDVVEKIHNGNSIYIASCGATAENVLKAMTDDWKLADILVIQLIPGGNLPHLSESIDRFRTFSFYSFQKTGYFRNGGYESLQDYSPSTLGSVPRLLEEGKLHVDVAIIKVTPPHKSFCSLGMGVELTKDFIRHAKLVIAEVNENMPWTEVRQRAAIVCSFSP
jgi:4-hydroxybutyrate CoA-transferase